MLCSDGNYRREQCDSSLSCPDNSWSLVPNPQGSQALCYRADDFCWKDLDHVSEEQLLAAIVYGEASTKEDMNEMYAIASATMNMVNAHLNHTFLKYNNMIEFFKSKRFHEYSKALANGNTRFRLVMCEENINGRFDKAYEAAKNALSGGKIIQTGLAGGMDMIYKPMVASIIDIAHLGDFVSHLLNIIYLGLKNPALL